MGASEAMVTARMSREKKELGGAILETLGTNASQVINSLYDYVIEHRSLPFNKGTAHLSHTPDEIAKATALVDSLMNSQQTSWSELSLKEVRRRRLNL
ncbi:MULTISPECIES: type II toxin-antitoxin system RelB/DinJ family antitoxin [unclassified Adlercreutzia]|uniref:type II toxin-antitoxin system RelB/DinJ family antitoxin n=1 Tax=unclassified Adlercreutzia TaxID=2636013 RepID=UPI0013EB3AAE|nr:MULTISPECIES: type II toxin-antitoxin system RelB/DinJ family antitoxin [unclassified Adlercreutzia]